MRGENIRYAQRTVLKGAMRFGWTAALVLCVMWCLAGPVKAASDSVSSAEDLGPKAFDALVLRPIGGVRLVMGAALWVPVTLIWPPLYKENFEQFVSEPATCLIDRSLGEDLWSDCSG